jgi:hypothetical protein
MKCRNAWDFPGCHIRLYRLYTVKDQLYIALIPQKIFSNKNIKSSPKLNKPSWILGEGVGPCQFMKRFVSAEAPKAGIYRWID